MTHHRRDGSIITMCVRKRKFGRKTAQAIAERKHMRAYQCPICNRWHLTRKDVRT